MNYKIYGFSLTELLIVLTILAMICLFFMPYYSQYQAKQEAILTINKVQIQLRQIPHETLLYRQRIIFCSSRDFKQCDNDWAHGYIVFIDKNRNSLRDPDEKILRTQAFHLKYGTLQWNGFLSQSKLFFDAHSGLPIASNGTFKYCSHTSNSHHKKLVLSRMGQIRVEPILHC